MIARFLVCHLIFFSGLSAAAVDQTWQRSQILGATESGDKLLVFKSHFGPSSRAPFAQLQILVPGTSVPVFEDGRSAFQGDESTIIQLKNDLLDAHAKRIQDEEISLSTFESTNSIAFETDNEMVIESDLFNEGDISRFRFEFRQVNDSSCPSGVGRPLSFSWLDKTPLQTASVSIDKYFECNVSRYKFSRQVAIGNTIWTFVFAPTEVMPDLFFYPQIIFGLPLR